MTRRLHAFHALLGSLLLLSSCALLSQPAGPQLENPELDELSGLASSLAAPDLLWGHNDSGDAPRLFRIGPRGEDLGFVPIQGAVAIDWEDIAAFRWQGEPALLIGDVGDNHARREHVTLYAVRDPGARGEPKLLWTLDFKYPDGPRDCEAVAVDPVDQSVILISKREHPQRLYRLPIPKDAPRPGSMAVAEALGPITTLPRSSFADWFETPLYSEFDGPTALDIDPAGRFAVVITYKDAFLYPRAEGQSWREAFAATPRLIRLPHLRQTEAGAISSDGRTLTVSGEGVHMAIARVPLAP